MVGNLLVIAEEMITEPENWLMDIIRKKKTMGMKKKLKNERVRHIYDLDKRCDILQPLRVKSQNWAKAVFDKIKTTFFCKSDKRP